MAGRVVRGQVRGRPVAAGASQLGHAELRDR
jgi:hypothetical protein